MLELCVRVPRKPHATPGPREPVAVQIRGHWAQPTSAFGSVLGAAILKVM